MDLDTRLLIERILAPLLAALFAWLLKDVLLKTYASRRDEARREWLYRLREIYSPLFLWSGVVLFESDNTKDKVGVRELTEVLSKAANLLPIREYYVFVRMLEQAMRQSTEPPDGKDIARARDYVYSQIEMLNFALFRQPEHFDVTVQSDILAPFRYLARAVFSVSIQLVLWFSLFGVLWAAYLAVLGKPVAVVLSAVLVLLLLAAEAKRRLQMIRTLKHRMRT